MTCERVRGVLEEIGNLTTSEYKYIDLYIIRSRDFV